MQHPVVFCSAAMRINLKIYFDLYIKKQPTLSDMNKNYIFLTHSCKTLKFNPNQLNCDSTVRVHGQSQQHCQLCHGHSVRNMINAWLGYHTIFHF